MDKTPRRENFGHSPTLRARQLALELIRRREEAQLSREEVADRLEWSTSTIFRIETGRSKPQPRSVRQLLDLYGIAGAEREGLLQLARDARQPGWWHSFRDVLPNPYEVYIGLESGAASIRNFEPLIIPGLLQTQDYARATFRSGPRELNRNDVDRRTEVRMARQYVLARPDRPRLWVVIDEAAVRRVVGSPRIMREQLHHLLKAAEEGTTTLQVVPFSAGAHAGTTGPFVILGLTQPTDADLVYIETLAGDIYLEKRKDIDRYMIAFERLLAAALHPDESATLIQQAADDLV